MAQCWPLSLLELSGALRRFPPLVTEAVLAAANRALSHAVQQEEDTNTLEAGGGRVQKCRKKKYEHTQATRLTHTLPLQRKPAGSLSVLRGSNEVGKLESGIWTQTNPSPSPSRSTR